MDDNILQQVGHFIGQTRAEVLELTDGNIEKAVELLRDDLVVKQDVIRDALSVLDDSVGDRLRDVSIDQAKQLDTAKVEVLATTVTLVDDSSKVLRGDINKQQESMAEYVNQLIDTVDDKIKGLSFEHVEQIALMTEQIKAQEIFETLLTDRIAQIKDGDPGEPGEPGQKGDDGLDRPLVEPVEIANEKDYPKSTVGTFDGGLWIATKQTVGSPTEDPQAWHCMLDAMSTMSIDIQPDLSYKLSVRMASGELIEDTFDIPFPKSKGVWEEGTYSAGDIVTKGHSMWQALEDTDGSPPGNGWKQILSAPRGGRGPEGKSITGPQGVPGRNGTDAKLPDGFIEEVRQLASQSKAFEEDRSAAYAITSFRGYFSGNESYRVGDLVNHNDSIYLCIRSGSYRTIAADASAWELILNVPKHVQVGYMHWQGQWEQKTYNGGMTVRDGDWTMVANTQTNERAAPLAVGPELYLYSGTMTPFENTAKSVLYGQRIANLTSDVFVNGYKVDVIAGNKYEIYLVTNPETAPIFDLVNSFTASATGEEKYTISQRPFQQGKVIDLLCYVSEVDDTPTQYSGNWFYDTPNNQGVPGPGVALQSNGVPSSLRISYIDDDGGDREAELNSLTVGDTITGGTTWLITAMTPSGTYMDFGVTPAQQAGPDGVRDFTFDTVTATPITIGRDVDYWLNNANVVGLFVADGNYADLVPDQNAYGIIDILYQDASISDDWDVVTPGTGGAGGAVLALTAQETEWTKANAFGYRTELHPITTTDNAWTEFARYEMNQGQARKVAVNVDGKRRNDIGYYSANWNVIAWNDTGVESYATEGYELGVTTCEMRVRDVGDEIIFEIKGQNAKTWDFQITLFVRDVT